MNSLDLRLVGGNVNGLTFYFDFSEGKLFCFLYNLRFFPLEHLLVPNKLVIQGTGRRNNKVGFKSQHSFISAAG